MKYLLMILGTITVIATTAVAQNKHERKAKRGEAFQDLRSDLRVWFEREVYPTAKVWHQEYDASLSPEDLSALQGMRSEAKRLRDAVMNDLKQLRGSFTRGDRAELRDKIEDLRDRHRDAVEDLLIRLKPIAKRSRAKLRELFDTHEDQIDTWRAQARSIVRDWREEHEDLSFKGMFGRHHQLPLIAGDGRKAAVRFILWDGSLPAAPDGGVFAPQRIPLSVSPAPTGSMASVDASNVPDGQHTLQVYDMNGTLVRTATVSAASGKISHQLDLSGLPAGTYMVSINTPAGRSTTNVVITR